MALAILLREIFMDRENSMPKNNSRFTLLPDSGITKKLKMHERQQNSGFVYKIENLFLESPRNIYESKKAFANFFAHVP